MGATRTIGHGHLTVLGVAIASAALLLAPPAAGQAWTRARPDAQAVGPDGAFDVPAPGDGTPMALEIPVDPMGATGIRIEVLPPGGGTREWIEVRELRVIADRKRVGLGTPSASDAPIGFPASAAVDGRSATAWRADVSSLASVELVVPFSAAIPDPVESLRVELSLAGKAARIRVSLTDHRGRLLAEGAENARRAFNGKVSAAIDLGVEHLLSTQLPDGSWGHHQPSYPSGGTALCAYALLKSGLSPDHLSIRRALAHLERVPPKKTYELGCTLMLYAALDDPTYRDLAQDALDLTLKFQHGDFGYSAGGAADLSNTQYGALALWAAERLELSVPRRAWEELAAAVLPYQEQKDGPVSGALGFGYRHGSPATSTMTGAAVGILALAETYLGQLKPEEKRALDQGIAWLHDEFKPRANWGGTWRLYYLYGIERLGAFLELEELAGADWHHEGSRYLVDAQNPGNGGWPRSVGNTTDTSFALLFLQRASAPTSGGTTRRGTRTFGGDDPKIAINLRAAGDSPMSIWVSSFGEQGLADHGVAPPAGQAPRVAAVDYVIEGGAILPGAREGGAEWRWAVTEPAEGWQRGDFDDAAWRKGTGGFGRAGSPNVVVRTPWKHDELWLRRTLDVDLERLFEPRLELVYGAGRDPAELGLKEELVKLFDEEPGIVDTLGQRPEGSTIQYVSGGASGPNCLRVAGVKAFSPAVPGWSFPIREDPRLGQFRYLRFGWKTDSPGVLVELAIDGQWTRSVRYYAGKLEQAYANQRPHRIDRDAPARWEQVTVDLFEGLGGIGNLTGIALTPMSGEALFDGIYLARTERELRNAKKLRDEETAWSRPAPPPPPPAPGRVEVWVNGEQVSALDRETVGTQVLLAGDDLRDVLVDGENQIAVYAKNEGGRRAVDVALRDHRLLAHVPGNPAEPATGERFAANLAFPLPGTYQVTARALIVDAATGERVPVDSPPISVLVTDTPSPELVESAGRSEDDLLDGNLAGVLASSALSNQGPDRLLDGLVASGWRCTAGDVAPTLYVNLKRAAKADTLLLSIFPGDGPRPVRVRVIVDGEVDEAVVHEIDPDPLVENRVPLGKARKMRSIEVLVLERTGTDGGKLPSVGFSELELVLADD